ncbi:prepilin peptidase [Nocardioides sp. URHA0020]|uniref:prepilin peptidase n=1 Tax=Nocardioides sp. URHA0020 TaxID=1380392 RepID=UPI00068483AC|nr:prepilin peptidase [Nocardioides sp. URHA0020]
MSVDLAGAVLGAALCGPAGAGVPRLIARIPEPVPPDGEEPVERYAPVAALPGLWWRAALVAAVAGALIGGAVGLDWALLLLLTVVPVSVALAVVDLHTHLLPTKVIWPTLGGTVVLAAVAALADGDPGAFLSAVVGGVVVFAVFHALWWVHPAGMGYGDVRLSAVVGFVLGYLGWAALLIGVYGAFLVFSLLGVARALVRRDRSALRTPLPFGPFLLGGGLLGIVLGSATWGYLVGT